MSQNDHNFRVYHKILALLFQTKCGSRLKVTKPSHKCHKMIHGLVPSGDT